MAVFGAENNMIPKFINLMVLAPHFHINNVIIDSMNNAGVKDGIQQRTLTIRLDTTPTQHTLFTQVIGLYNQAWGEVVAWCNKNQTANRTRLQKALYHQLRGKYPQLPAQFIAIVLRDAPGAIKSWNTQHKQQQWQLKAARKRQTLNYDLRIMSMRGNLLRLSTLQGQQRQTFLLNPPCWFTNRYPDTVLKAAKLSLKNSHALIHLIYNIQTPSPVVGTKTVGIDRGLKNIIYTSEGGVETSAKTKSIKRKYAHNRATLQAKGTRSAKRRLKAIAGREKRFISDVNHRISKTLAQNPNVAVYVMEDLKNMSKRREKKKHEVGKRMRSWLSGWSYHQLENYITYKSETLGKKVVFVSPAYTSQRCNRCGYVNRNNRDGARFDCLQCSFHAHADYNAACNIRDKYLFAIDGKAGRSQSPIMDETTTGSRPSLTPRGGGN